MAVRAFLCRVGIPSLFMQRAPSPAFAALRPTLPFALEDALGKGIAPLESFSFLQSPSPGRCSGRGEVGAVAQQKPPEGPVQPAMDPRTKSVAEPTEGALSNRQGIPTRTRHGVGPTNMASDTMIMHDGTVSASETSR